MCGSRGTYSALPKALIPDKARHAPHHLPSRRSTFRRHRRACNLLQVMDAHQATRSFLTGDHPSRADLAHYLYIARAREGGIAHVAYANVQRRLDRIEQLPRFVPMPKSA